MVSVMPIPRTRSHAWMAGALLAAALASSVLWTRSPKEDVRVLLTDLKQSNGIIQVTAVVTNRGPLTYGWWGPTTPFSAVRWLGNDGWVTSDVPSLSKSSGDTIWPGKSYETTIEVPASARRIQVLGDLEVISRVELLSNEILVAFEICGRPH